MSPKNSFRITTPTFPSRLEICLDCFWITCLMRVLYFFPILISTPRNKENNTIFFREQSSLATIARPEPPNRPHFPPRTARFVRR